MTGRLALFTDDPGWHGKQLRLAFAQHGYDCEFVSLTDCRFEINANQPTIKIPGFEDRLPGAVFVRGVPGGSLQEVVLYLDILHALKIMNIPVYNNGHAIERSVDKGMTSFLLHNAGLPTPLTWVLRDREQALAIAENELKNGHLLISKPLFGSQGEGIRRIEKMTDLLWLTASGGVYYLQRFVHCAGVGFSDKRVFVINGQAVAAMRRRGKSWLNNVAQGASCERIELNDEVADLAIKATAALSMDYAGVDIIQDTEGRYSVIEVNSIPAWKGLESVCKLNIAQLLADDLINRYLIGGQALPDSQAKPDLQQPAILKMKPLEHLYQQACEVELQAFKPGNVSIYSAAHDMTVDDFRLSAKVSASPLCNPDYSLGEKIFYAVKATREAVGCNTNLGIILLCAPLIQAVSVYQSGMTLRQALQLVLNNTTVADADWTFKAIALAAPAGLGTIDKQDVKQTASVTLQAAMKLASEKDRIALQYLTDYKDIFDFSVLRYNCRLLKWGNHSWAAVAVYADLLSHYPDSHIERKYGDQYTGMVASRMIQLSNELSNTENPELIMPLLHSIDQELKSKRVNPGTTADMTVATVLTVFLENFVNNR